MRRRFALWLIGLVLVGSGLYSTFFTGSLTAAALTLPAAASPGTLPMPRGDLRALVVYAPDMRDSRALAAWTQVLHEEGFAFDLLSDPEAAALGGAGLASRYPALILPDEAARALSDEAADAVSQYVLRHGGKLLAALDAGTEGAGGSPRPHGALAALIGADYWQPGRRITPTTWRLPPSSPLHYAFDPGLLDRHDSLQIYGYPELQTRHLLLRQVEARPLAFAGGSDDSNHALVLEQASAGGGLAMYVNADLAYHKYHHNDDFLLRDLLRFFLIQRAGLPRLVAAPNGVGGLVLNIHVCAGTYYPALATILRDNLFSRDLRFSFHITAGPDNDRPGDGKGVGVEQPRGRALVQALARYGNIGSQGGWIHNYFALTAERLPEGQIDQYIDRNYAALEAASDRPVLEYSAPGGVHSAHINDLLARWGTRAAAVPNSFFSPPTHAWWDGQREDRFWLFGYTGSNYGFCFENMLDHRSPGEAEADMERLLRTVVRSRQIRQFYTHPGKIAEYPRLWLEVQNSVLDKVRAGRLTVRPMAEYAEFMDRHQQVLWQARREGAVYHLTASAPGSLREMTFALPTGGRTLAAPPWGRVSYEGSWAYVTVTANVSRVSANLALGPHISRHST